MGPALQQEDLVCFRSTETVQPRNKYPGSFNGQLSFRRGVPSRLNTGFGVVGSQPDHTSQGSVFLVVHRSMTSEQDEGKGQATNLLELSKFERRRVYKAATSSIESSSSTSLKSMNASYERPGLVALPLSSRCISVMLLRDVSVVLRLAPRQLPPSLSHYHSSP